MCLNYQAGKINAKQPSCNVTPTQSGIILGDMRHYRFVIIFVDPCSGRLKILIPEGQSSDVDPPTLFP
jgi:hypothetical protein